MSSVSDTLDSGIERNGIDKRLVLYRVLAFPPSVFSQQSDFHCRIPYWQFSPFVESFRPPTDKPCPCTSGPSCRVNGTSPRVRVPGGAF